MNSTEKISIHKSHNYYNPQMTKKDDVVEYEFLDERPIKKDKKWSLSNLFRRKKKNESSSDEEPNKSLSNKKKRKSDKKKKQIPFDHVVLSKDRASAFYPTYHKGDFNESIMSDPSEIISKYSDRSLPAIPLNSYPNYNQQIVSVEITKTAVSHLSADNINKKSRKDLAKFRAEARRNSLSRNSSSEDESQHSNSSRKFRSDESLTKYKDGSMNRRSRAARTERYLKRHSRDGENPNNYLRLSKSDADSFLRLSDDSFRSPSRSPTTPNQMKLSYSSLSSQSPSITGVATIPPSHLNHTRFKVSNSTSNPSYKPPLSMNDYNNSKKNILLLDNQRSRSFDNNIQRDVDSNVVHVKLPITKPNANFKNISVVNGSQSRNSLIIHQPPPPPPRDLNRLGNGGSLDYNQILDDVQLRNNRERLVPQIRKFNSVNLDSNFRSTSEVHIPGNGSQISLVQRPSSATPEYKNKTHLLRSDPRSRSDNYQYLTDKHPRSRKPIFIQNSLNNLSMKTEGKNDSKLSLNSVGRREDSSTAFLNLLKAKKDKKNNPTIFTCSTQVQNKIFLPSVLHTDTDNSLDKNQQSSPHDKLNVNKTLSDQNCNNWERKSANLEEALNELEAIYNSLKLGDEELLERAEQRENLAATKKMLESGIPMWRSSAGALSDSGFNYEPFDSVESRRKKYTRASLKSDDMAVRKLTRNMSERAATINDPQQVASRISYLLSSPAYNSDVCDDDNTNEGEPDITKDDVLYRSILQSRKLKVPQVQPPFGIPLGPITHSSNSDYLHAVPDSEGNLRKPSKIPDIVKDDLAYRNLRKDSTKEPALSPLSPDDVKNNNAKECEYKEAPKLDLSLMRKKRAIRSRSVNIGSLISKEVIERAARRNAASLDENNDNEFKCLTDIADAMNIARQVLKEKEQKISETKRASMSDTDVITGASKYVRYPVAAKRNLENRAKFFGEGYSQNDSKTSTREQVKETTPVPSSSFEDSPIRQILRTTSFEDALTALAIEAKEASDRITQELNNLDETSEPLKNLQNENNMTSSFVHSDILDREVENMLELSQSPEDTNKDKKEDALVYKNAQSEDKFVEHDYENISEHLSDDNQLIGKKYRSTPFKECKAQLQIAVNELDDNDQPERDFLDDTQPITLEISQIDDGCSKTEIQGEMCVDVVPFSACAVDECVSNMRDETCLSSSSSEISFRLDFENGLTFELSGEQVRDSGVESAYNLDSLESLKSPKLVLETSKLKSSKDESKDEGKKRALRFDNSSLPKRGGSNLTNKEIDSSRDRRHISDDVKICSGAWHSNAATLAVACSYGLACATQMASLDLFSILGIIFAILTFIAALFL